GQVGALDLPALAAEVTDELRPTAERKGLDLRLSAPADLPPLYTDRRLVRLVVGNPLHNGVKVTAPGGGGPTPGPAGGGRGLTGRDPGRGIPPEQQAAIFEPFEHLEPLQRKHTPGVGLGLTVVKELVQALGGRVEVTSRPGQGSTFTVMLPSLSEAAYPVPRAVAAPA